jgi:hypothetical protein
VAENAAKEAASTNNHVQLSIYSHIKTQIKNVIQIKCDPISWDIELYSEKSKTHFIIGKVQILVEEKTI